VLAGRGRAVGLYRALQATRSCCGAAVRRLHQPLRVPAKESPLLKGRTAASGLENQGAAVQLSCADALRRFPLGHVPKVRPYWRAGYQEFGWRLNRSRVAASACMHTLESRMRCFEPFYDSKVSELLALTGAAARLGSGYCPNESAGSRSRSDQDFTT
jgi:hypothetical protein